METVNKVSGLILVICGWAFIILMMVGCGLSEKSKGKDTILNITWYLRWVLLLVGIVFLITWLIVLR